jgi:hypothetical protein
MKKPQISPSSPSLPPPSNSSSFPQFRTIVAVDPGPRNTGYLEFDRTKKKVVRAEKVAFREKQSKNEPRNVSAGNLELIDSVKKFCKENETSWGKRDACIFVEDQIMGRLRYTQEPSLIQYVFYTLYGPPVGRCVIVPPHSVKSHFRQYFPRLERKEGEAENNFNERQYRFDKANSVKYGRRFMDSDILDELDEDKMDDVMDALWIALYVDELMDGKASYSDMKKEEKRKEKQEEREKKAREKKEEKQRKREETKKEKSKAIKDISKKRAKSRLVEIPELRYDFEKSESGSGNDSDLIPLSELMKSANK